MRYPALARSLAVTGAVLLLPFASCSKDKGSGDMKKEPDKFASCDVIKIASSCREYNEDNLAIGDKHLKQICDASKGTFRSEPCPKEKRIGICVKPEGSDVYYSEGGLTMKPDEIAKMCEGTSGGKWKKLP
jgi:hypothetical protein